MSDSAVIAFIVAAAENGVIGAKGAIPWRLSSDLKRFRALTLGKPVVMGRKTWDSLPTKPLDGRDNIVVTRQAGWSAPGALVARSVGEAIVLAERLARERGAGEIAVIGGAQIFAELLPRAGRVYFTLVHASPPGDAQFPDLDPSEWRKASQEEIPAGPKDEHASTFIVLERWS